jgi:uncharacterized protein YqgV (UPF0045/DUF77 family)
MIAEIQCLPSPSGTGDEPYRHVGAAITALDGTGLHHEVGALGTTLEGPDDEVWGALRAAHDAALAAGARSIVSVVKVYSTEGAGPSMDDLVADHR